MPKERQLVERGMPICSLYNWLAIMPFDRVNHELTLVHQIT
jgi:hypothetical protein